MRGCVGIGVCVRKYDLVCRELDSRVCLCLVAEFGISVWGLRGFGISVGGVCGESHLVQGMCGIGVCVKKYDLVCREFDSRVCFCLLAGFGISVGAGILLRR